MSRALAEVSIGTPARRSTATGGCATRRATRSSKRRARSATGPMTWRKASIAPRSMTVGLLTNDSFGRFSFPIVEALEQRLGGRGIAVFMCNATDDPARERQHLDQLMRKRIDGLVVTARRADMRPAVSGPSPACRSSMCIRRPMIRIRSASFPTTKAARALAVDHLIALGRKRIAHIAGPERFDAVRLRKPGHQHALAAAKIAFDPRASIVNGPWSESWGREAVADTVRRRWGRARCAVLRQRPDRARCGRSVARPRHRGAGRRRHRRLRQLGRDDRWPRGRRSPAST